MDNEVNWFISDLLTKPVNARICNLKNIKHHKLFNGMNWVRYI